MPDNTTNTKSEDPQYIIETLKAKDKDKQLYYIYPVTKEGAITDKHGMNLEEKLSQMQNTMDNKIITANVPVNLWRSNDDIYIAIIDNLSIDTNANYEIVIDHSNLSDSVYISLASCFIVPSNYTNSSLTLKALSKQPTDPFSIFIIRR